MKKFFATAAAALMLAVSSPALADVTSEVEGDENDTFTAQFVDASQAQLAVGAQFGDVEAEAEDESTAEASNELSITQNQANAGLGEIDDLNQGDDNVGDFFLD